MEENEATKKQLELFGVDVPNEVIQPPPRKPHKSLSDQLDEFIQQQIKENPLIDYCLHGATISVSEMMNMDEQILADYYDAYEIVERYKLAVIMFGLKDPQVFAQNLLTSIGFKYEPN